MDVTGDLYLYALRPNGVQTALGRVTLRDLTALSVDQRSQPGNVELLGRFKPDLPVPTPGDPINHFIELRPRASGGLSTWGRWSVKPTTLPSFAAEAEFTWTWEVSAGDLDAVERRHVGKRVIEIRLTVEGLAALDGQVLPVWGQVDLRMFRTEWEDKILTPLKRPLPPSWEQVLPDAQRARNTSLNSGKSTSSSAASWSRWRVCKESSLNRLRTSIRSPSAAIGVRWRNPPTNPRHSRS